MLGIVSEPDEEWRPVVGHRGRYEVSNLGRVKSVRRLVKCRVRHWRREQLMTQHLNRGYPTVWLCKHGKPRPASVHRLVCEAFHGPKPSDHHEVAHNDGTRDNNRADNLRWATRSENQEDRKVHGTELKPWTTDEATALEIIARLNRREGHRTIANALGVSRWTVQHIWRGNSWKSLHHLLDKAA